VTSDVLCRARREQVIRAHPSGLRRSGLAHSALASRVSPNLPVPCARPASARRLVKDDCLREPGRLPSTSAPSTRPSRFTRPRIASQARKPLVPGLDGSPPPFSQLCRHEPASDARSPLAPVKEERLDLPPSGGMGQAPLVDFCNQNTPRARPLDRPNPDSARLGDCALRARPGGTRPPLQPLVGESLFVAPDAPLERNLEHDDELSPDLLLRVVPFLAERLQPRFHGPGTRGLSPARRPPPRLLATEASPRPDPLEHLVSRARRDAGRRSRRRRHVRSEARVSITNPPDEPACAWLVERPAYASHPPMMHSSHGRLRAHARLRRPRLHG
jgi:hypothetical protein